MAVEDGALDDLQTIGSAARQTAALSLLAGNVLGAEVRALLNAVLLRQAGAPPDPASGNASPPPSAGTVASFAIVSQNASSLVFTGTLTGLAPSSTSSVPVVAGCLLDLPATAARTAGRHVILSLTPPDGLQPPELLAAYSRFASAASFLSGEGSSPLLASISFAPRSLVFSSIDFADPTYLDAALPTGFSIILPAQQVRDGLNFDAEFELAAPIAAGFAMVALPARMTASCCVRRGNQYPLLIVAPSVTAKEFDLAAFEFELWSVSFAFALDLLGEAYPVVSLELGLSIGSAKAALLAVFDIAGRSLRLGLAEHLALPGLDDLAKLLKLDDVGTLLPANASGYGAFTLHSLDLGVTLSPLRFTDVGFAITAERPVTLIDNIIAVTPTLSVAVASPFDTSGRSTEVDLAGRWMLGTTAFDAALSLTDNTVDLEMAAGQTLDVAALVDKVLPGVHLPSDAITLIDLEISGNWQEKSFEGHVDVASSWQMDLAGATFAVEDLGLDVAYDDGRTTECQLSGVVIIAGLELDLLAQYDADSSSWRVHAGTFPGESLSLTGLADRLAKDLDALGIDIGRVPDEFVKADVAVKDLFLEHSTAGGGGSTFYCSLDHKLTITDGFVIDTLFVRMDTGPAGLALQGRMMITVGGVDVFLGARKQGAAWRFTGGTQPDEPIPVGALITDVAAKFGLSGGLPLFPQDLTLENLDLSFDTGTRDLSFAGKLELTIEGETVTLTVAAQAAHGRSGYAVDFVGVLQFGSLRLDLAYHSGAKADDSSAVRFTIPSANLSDIASLFLKALGAPADLGSFALADIAVAYDRKSGFYILSARIADPITVAGPSWAIESAQFSARRDGLGVYAEIAGTLELGGQAIAVAAAYQSGQGWAFSGKDATPLPLGRIADDLAAKLGVALPIAVDDLLVTGLGVAFTTGAAGSFGLTFAIATAGATPERWGELALAMRRRDDGEWDHLVDIAIVHDFGLRSLPVAGGHLPDLRVHSLRCTVASRAFTATEAAALGGSSTGAAVAAGASLMAVCDMPDGAPLQLGTPSDPAPPAASANAPVLAPAAGGAGDRTKWFDVHKGFSGLTFDRVGLRYADGRATLLFDMALALGPIHVGLLGLGLGSPLTRFAPVASLDGLALAYEAGPVNISGGFAALGGGRYEGFVTVSLQAVSLAARGMYATNSAGKPSIFVYGLLDKPPLGGPPAFFVDGVAFGLGIESQLHIPPIEGLDQFSLLQGVIPNTAAPDDPDNLDKMLARMSRDIVPTAGANWIAAGVRFNSFRIVESFALLTLQAGSRVQVELLGLSTASIPPMASSPIAAIEVMLEASFDPTTGNLAVDGKLSPNSFVFSHDCHLMGGFAYRSWVTGEHAGDFVLSIGGYHPRFPRERFPHYPPVDRLGYVWNISDELQVKGSSYFALTPACLMAGGSLEAVWSSGGVSAWFDVDADFLMYWKPFHYMADASCSIGVSVRIHLLFTSVRITIHIGADLHFEGPPFGGEAHIDLWCVSFTIHFGSSQDPPPPLPWRDFKTSFLARSASGSDGAVTAPESHLVTITPSGGLIRDFSKEANRPADYPRWVFHPEDIALRTGSAVPGTAASFNAAAVKDDGQDWTVRAIAVGPSAIAAGDFGSEHVVSITLAGKPAALNLSESLIVRSVPARLWTPQGGSRSVPQDALDSNGLLHGTLAGIEIRRSLLQPDATRKVPIASLQLEFLSRRRSFQWSSPAAVSGAYDETISGNRNENMTFAVNGRRISNRNFVLSGIGDGAPARGATIAAMADIGMAVGAVDLTALSTTTELNDWPVVSPLGGA